MRRPPASYCRGSPGIARAFGAAQDLLAADVGLPEVMRQGRWKSERMPVRYAQDLAAERSGMAKLLALRGLLNSPEDMDRR